MIRLSRLGLLAGVLTLTLWLAGSQPVQATPSCWELDQDPCYPHFSFTPCVGPAGEDFQCDCLIDRWQCPW